MNMNSEKLMTNFVENKKIKTTKKVDINILEQGVELDVLTGKKRQVEDSESSSDSDESRGPRMNFTARPAHELQEEIIVQVFNKDFSKVMSQ